jgi:hypothetical protein
MRICSTLGLLLVCACTRRPPYDEADAAAVYEAYLGMDQRLFPERVMLQEVTEPVTPAMVDVRPDGGAPRIPPGFQPAVQQALRDLLERGRTPRPLAAAVEVTGADVRISADSVNRIFHDPRNRDLHRLPDRASVVQLSAVGFSRDRTVAVVYQNVVCGSLCGGAEVRVVRRHPGGWIPAEQLTSVIY